MSNNSANKELQLAANDFKDLANVPLYVWVIFILLALTMAGVTPVWLGVLGSIVAVLANHSAERSAKQREAKARAAAYANIKGPVIVRSYTPNDDALVIRERANEWRENIKLSGNIYAHLIPVIEFPYNPMLYNTLQLSKSWEQYEMDFILTVHNAYIEWHNGKCPNELKGIFANGVLPSPQTTNPK